MKRFRTVAMAGSLGVAALGLIGAGAHAVFTTSTTSSQQITAGTLSVEVSAPGATCTATDAFGHCTAISLPVVGPVSSTFDTTPVDITLTNVGSLPAYFTSVTVSDPNSNSIFQSELGVCEYGLGTDGHYLGVENNGLLSDIEGTQDLSGSGPYYVIQPGDSDAYSVDFYAGGNSSVCGGSAIPSLTNGAENGSVTVNISYAFQDQPNPPPVIHK